MLLLKNTSATLMMNAKEDLIASGIPVMDRIESIDDKISHLYKRLG